MAETCGGIAVANDLEQAVRAAITLGDGSISPPDLVLETIT
jgi:hypothetical protein